MEQVYDYARLLILIEHIADCGSIPHGRSVEHLERGVWEFKFGERRLTYWDTPGDGSFAEHVRYEHKDECDDPLQEFWWYPEMDGVLRLGVAWPKTGKKAPPASVERALELREEDCEHDR